MAGALLTTLVPAGAQDPATGDPPVDTGGDDAGLVVVLKVSGLIDPILAAFIEDEIADAERAGVTAVVLQVNSPDSVVSDDRLASLVGTIRDSAVTVGAWVGPSGSVARGPVTELVAAADVSGVAPGSRIELTRALVGGEVDLDGRAAVGETIGSELAVELGVVTNDAPVLGDFIVDLPGVVTEVVDERRQLVTPVRFGQLQLVDQLFHTVASPAVAYLLLVIGGSLLIFELFTAGVGVAGMVGAGSLVLSAYGLAVLPVNGWALVLLVLCFPAFGVDVQTGVPRLWSAVGAVALIVGSLALFERGGPSWITLGAGILGTLLGMLGGMPAMVRTRFSTPTIGRDWMIGETGVAVVDVNPDGVVTVRDAPWRAHTNRATPITAGDQIKVAGIDGLTLTVEPLEGAARDHRDRKGRD